MRKQSRKPIATRKNLRRRRIQTRAERAYPQKHGHRRAIADPQFPVLDPENGFLGKLAPDGFGHVQTRNKTPPGFGVVAGRRAARDTPVPEACGPEAEPEFFIGGRVVPEWQTPAHRGVCGHDGPDRRKAVRRRLRIKDGAEITRVHD